MLKKAILISAALVGSTFVWADAQIINSQPVGQRAASNDAPASNNSMLEELFFENQRLRQELLELRGQVEELDYEVRQLREENRERYLELDSRISEIVQSQLSQAPTPTPAPANAPAQQDPEALYEAAREKIAQRDLEGAIESFENFVVLFPEHELAPNAYYWLGEVQALLPDWEAALVSFSQVVDGFSVNNKTPDAMYKLGIAYEALGDAELAQRWYNTLISEFPDSQAARLAEKKLP